MLDILIFNVRLGQCVAFLPYANLDTAMMVDCGHEGDFHPIDWLIENGVQLPKGKDQKVILGNLTLTNYDEDHFSGLPHLMEIAELRTVNFPSNLNSGEIRQLKDEVSLAMEHVLYTKDAYDVTATNFYKPYEKAIFYLMKNELTGAGIKKLKQII